MNKNKKHVVLAGAIGNVLEWYDFTIYAFFVPIIAVQFFPNQDPFLSLIATFGVFALGFIVRPLGAILFGYIGDHAGRKKALVLSMIMMSVPTFLIGVLPHYGKIGLFAPLSLMGLRLIQGLAVSGELTTATVFLIEHAEPHRRGIAGSLAMSGALAGMVISSCFASLLSMMMSNESLIQWGWRVPFLVGGVIGLIGLVIRLKTTDPMVFEAAHLVQLKTASRPSVVRHLHSLPYRKLLLGILLTSIMASANYFLIAYFNTFLIETQHLALRTVMLMNTVALAIQMTQTILMGRLSDFIGRKKVLGTGMLGLFILAYPIFWLLTQQDWSLVFLGECLFAISAGAVSGVIPVTLTEMFDTYHRNMGISISYNVALALFGGTVPLIAITLVRLTNNNYAPAWYLMACAAVGLCALMKLKESFESRLGAADRSPCVLNHGAACSEDPVL